MSQSMVLAAFAFLVVGVSFVRLLCDTEFYRLTAMKRKWGRIRGLTFHFVLNVALPLVAGIVFLAQGVAGFGHHSSRAPGEDLVYVNLLELSRHAANSDLTRHSDDAFLIAYNWQPEDFTQLCP